MKQIIYLFAVLIIVNCGGGGSSSSQSSGNSAALPQQPVASDSEVDQWTQLSPANPPANVCYQTAVWTGSKMITFAGRTAPETFVSAGAVYTPSTNAWTPVNASGRPGARTGHRAIWTGTEMIVFGGTNGQTALDTGGRYNPTTDTWAALSAAGKPSPRTAPSMIWTGSEVIVYGGASSNGAANFVKNGARYNPATNTWSAMADGTIARAAHTGVWTGTEMLVFGGLLGGATISEGEIYNQATNTWRKMSTVNQPSPRYHHSAVWTGSKMIIFGGEVWGTELQQLADGAIYDPQLDQWEPLPMAGTAPSAQAYQKAEWTGSKMLIFGGTYLQNSNWVYSNVVYAYDPKARSWSTLSTTNAPTPRANASTVWTGKEVYVFGGGTWPSANPTVFNCRNDLFKID